MGPFHYINTGHSDLGGVLFSIIAQPQSRAIRSSDYSAKWYLERATTGLAQPQGTRDRGRFGPGSDIEFIEYPFHIGFDCMFRNVQGVADFNIRSALRN